MVFSRLATVQKSVCSGRRPLSGLAEKEQLFWTPLGGPQRRASLLLPISIQAMSHLKNDGVFAGSYEIVFALGISHRVA